MRSTFTPFLLFACGSLAAQPNFPASYFAYPMNEPFTSYSAEYVAPGPATNGFVFDVGDLVLGSAMTGQYVAPSSTPYSSSFPTATYASSTLSGGYGYVQVTSSQYLMLGIMNTDQSVIYSNPEQLFPIPLNSGSTWTDTWAAAVSASGFDMQRTGTTTGSYTSYGTLILPSGTFTNVARVQVVQDYSDVFMGMDLASYQTTIVSYLAPQYQQALFSSTSMVITVSGAGAQTIQSSSVIDPEAVSISENRNDLVALVAPNPAHGFTTIRFPEAIRGTVSLSLTDMLGREVWMKEVTISAAQQELPLDLDGLKAGLYHLRSLTADGRSATTSLVVE